MLKRLLPQETSFFTYFEQSSKLAIEACREFDALARCPQELQMRVNRIKEIEHQADEITHQCINALHSTFITPIDRSDIHRLIKRLDDIIDSLDSAAARMLMYELTTIRPETQQLTEVLITATLQIDAAVRDLPYLHKRGDEIQQRCIAVYEAENRGDDILRSALVHLFADEPNTIMIIKWKEIFERLERATDRCQEVANIISGIVIEAS